jgi:hypothetical protein
MPASQGGREDVEVAEVAEDVVEVKIDPSVVVVAARVVSANDEELDCPWASCEVVDVLSRVSA